MRQRGIFNLFVLPLLLPLSSAFAGQGEAIEVSGELRSYFFQRDFKADTTDREDLAIGGVLRSRIHLNPSLTAGISLYTSQGAGLNDDSKNVYSLLAKDANGNHENYTALGEGFLEANVEALTIRIGRQEMRTPWLNLHDVRMTPQSFDAATLRWGITEDTDLHLCHVTGMKYKTDTFAKSISETAGFGGDEPLSCLGLERRGELGVKLWGYRAHELWDDLYLRLDYKPEGRDWYINGRYLHRGSIGKRLAGDQNTWNAGITAGIQLDDLNLYGAVSKNGDRTILRKWGHDTTISSQVSVADRAQESAWKVGMKYDIRQIPGLKLGLSAASQNTPDAGIHQSPDRNEYNLDLQYKLDELLPGLSLRGRHSWVKERGAGAEDLNDLRFYIRYAFDL